MVEDTVLKGRTRPQIQSQTVSCLARYCHFQMHSLGISMKSEVFFSLESGFWDLWYWDLVHLYTLPKSSTVPMPLALSALR